MFEAAAHFAASLNFTQPYWLTLAGASGIGKTMLARAVYKQFMDQNRFEVKFDPARNHITGNTATFCNWRKFCDDVRSGSFGVVDDLCSDWFVILDDIGSEHDPSGFIASTLDRIINQRQGKWTLITTNLFLDQVAARLDQRVASRLLRNGGVVIECQAADYNFR